jgi:16S rRNA G1207 methylase RsmC
MVLEGTQIQLWSCSKFFCSFLEKNVEIITDKSILDIGCGIGVLGIVN